MVRIDGGTLLRSDALGRSQKHLIKEIRDQVR